MQGAYDCARDEKWVARTKGASRVRSPDYPGVGTIGRPATDVPVRYGSCSHQRSEMVSCLVLREKSSALTEVGMFRRPATSVRARSGSCSHQGFVVQIATRLISGEETCALTTEVGMIRHRADDVLVLLGRVRTRRVEVRVIHRCCCCCC